MVILSATEVVRRLHTFLLRKKQTAHKSQTTIHKLIYFTITCIICPHITFAIQPLSQFIHVHRGSRVQLAMRVYLKLSPEKKSIYITKSPN